MRAPPNILSTFSPPVMQARRWLADATFSDAMPLINVSQAAPVDPPPAPLREIIADVALNRPEAHLYGPVLGLPDLRAKVAADWSGAYGGEIAPEQVAITSGCNQAFCAAITTLAAPEDEVILPAPWYFNHKMWLDMQGIRAVPLACGPGMIPSADEAAALITAKTRAIVLVTPNNPTGAEYPAATLRAFYDLARAQGLTLIVDETYRDFHSTDAAPHDLFGNADWDQTLIQLYSFSKAYRLTGHRVGAVLASPARLTEIEKFLDTVTICPNQIGQYAALWGMQNLQDWLAGERAEILARRQAMQDHADVLNGWSLLGCGAYFAYFAHPFDIASDVLAQRLVQERATLMLPGTMFMPQGSAAGAQQLRIAFANIDGQGISNLYQRLASFAP